MQHGRRRNPYPHTWQIPLAVAAGLLLMLVFGVHIGRGVANLIAGNAWVFVDRSQLLTSLPGVLAGRADAGLVGVLPPAPYGLLWGSIAGVELLVLALSGAAFKAGWARWGPSRIEGTASREEVEELLGVARLRRQAALIRPDLHVPRGLLRTATRTHTRSVKTAGAQGAER